MLIIVIVTLNFIDDKSKYKFISDDTIYSWAKGKEMEVLDIKQVNEDEKKYSILFYKRENSIGNYYIYNYKNDDNYVKQTEFEIKRDSPVQYFSVSSGVPYIYFYINDQLIKDELFDIEVHYGDETFSELATRGKSHYLYVFENTNTDEIPELSLTLYDESKKILFSK